MKANVSSSQINRARKRAGTPAISAHIRANGNPEPLTDRISESQRRACLTRELETRQRRRAGVDILGECEHLRIPPEHFGVHQRLQRALGLAIGTGQNSTA